MSGTATTEKVHVEVPGFQGYGEFHGSNKDCSADAELAARHPFDSSELDANTLNAFWNEYWNSGHHTSGGATLDNIEWHLTGSAHKIDTSRVRIVQYVKVDQISLNDLHSKLIAAQSAGHTSIHFFGAAHYLPHGEQGVNGHFCALGGIDSDQGYKVANGDTVDALGGHGIIPCYWAGWATLAKAQINGMIELEKVSGSVIPKGWTDDGKTLKAPNGKVCVAGFRDKVLAWSGGFDPGNWPVNNEYASDSVEPGNPSIGQGTRQDFRTCSLGWTSSRGVYQIWAGQDLVALASEISGLTAQIAALQKTQAISPADAALLAVLKSDAGRNFVAQLAPALVADK